MVAAWIHLTAAFAVGIVGFSIACLQGRSMIGMLGAVLSVLGLVSFGIEGSHWVFEHNRSWLAFSPAIMFVLVVAAWLLWRTDAPDQTTGTTIDAL